jgi:hypothetical protein
MSDIPTDPEGLARAFGLGILALYGHTPKTAPPPLLGWVKAWRSNAEAILTATPALCKAAPAALGAAVINLAKMGLMPGIPGDASATGYLYPGQGGPMGVPSARGRIALARAAGVAVETYPVGVKDEITLDVDGDVAASCPKRRSPSPACASGTPLPRRPPCRSSTPPLPPPPAPCPRPPSPSLPTPRLPRPRPLRPRPPRRTCQRPPRRSKRPRRLLRRLGRVLWSRSRLATCWTCAMN